MSEENKEVVNALSNRVYEGVVIWFSRSSGFGFIEFSGGEILVGEGDSARVEPYNNDMFVHFSDLVQQGFKFLKKNQKVQFKIGRNNKGQPKAVEVVVIGDNSSVADNYR